jgi:hypothetical protein
MMGRILNSETVVSVIILKSDNDAIERESPDGVYTEYFEENV